jgi:hypothetical protein
MVTIKLLVQDPNGYFIRNIRRDNFVVYENGIRQQNATVEVEHATVSLRLLMEFGDRSPALNRELGRKSHELASIWWPSSLEEIDLQSGNMTTESRKSPTFRRTMRRLTPSSLSFLKLGTPELSAILRYYLHLGADATRDRTPKR